MELGRGQVLQYGLPEHRGGDLLPPLPLRGERGEVTESARARSYCSG